MGICIISHNSFQLWEQTGERPGCKYHRHTSSFHEAQLHVDNDEAFWTRLGDRAIIMFPCVERYTWQAKRSDGYSMLQMVPVGT